MRRSNQRGNYFRLLWFHCSGFRPLLSEAEVEISERKSCAPDSDPKQTIPKNRSVQVDGENVFLSNGPVFCCKRKSSGAERIKKGPHVFPLHVPEEHIG